MEISIDLIKKLRAETGISIKECKSALKEAKGNLNKATEILRKRGEKVMALKAHRETKAGVIECYIHQDHKQAGVVKLLCETDFVAKNEDFKRLAHDLAMQVVALKPKWLSPEDIPPEIIKKEREVYLKEIAASDKNNKPDSIKEKIIEGKLAKFYQENCLLKQPFIKDEALTIQELIASYVNKLGEKIEIGKFARFEI